MIKNSAANILTLTIIVLSLACTKPETWSDIPAVSFKSFEVKDSLDALDNNIKLCRLTITVKDGDGDIGIQLDDTSGIRATDSLHHNDLFLTMYSKKNGKYSLVNLQVPQNFRIPYVNQQGQNKSLKADVVVKMEYPVVLFKFDTIAYDFYIYDRALHKSNVDRTPDLIIGN